MHSLGDYWWQDPLFRKPSTWALIIMVVSLALLAGKVVSIASRPPAYQLMGVDRTTLTKALENTEATNTLTLFYEVDCKNCDVQIKHFLEMAARNPETTRALIISLDESAIKTGLYLREIGVPDSITTYYAPPEAQVGISALLRKMGSGGILRLPHTIVTKPDGTLLVEFSGYVRAKQMQRTLDLFNQSEMTK